MDGFRVGVDIGGTFTDVVVGVGTRLARRKLLSTPQDYAQAVVAGTQAALADLGIAASDPCEVIHATTIATNAILERRGGPCGVVTTAGFRDMLEIGRLRMPELYNLAYQKRPPLVPRRHVFEIDERIDAAGRIVHPLGAAALRRLTAAVKASGLRAIALCLLNSHVNAMHERRVATALRRAIPGLAVSVSSRILPRPGEYERCSTTMINAYVQGLVRSYLRALGARLRRRGIDGPIYVMQCSGGLTSARHAAEQPVTMVESGPAAGVLAAHHLAGRLGLDRVIAFDMGGTTAKAALIEEGRIHRTTEFEVGGQISATTRLTGGGGYPIQLPVIDVAEVGAGGGSIAWRDRGGGLRVGPRSAGAMPGPACYGRGGTDATVTDANLVLGYLDPRALAGGSLTLDPERAARAIDALAAPLGLDRLRAAHGIHLIANSEMTGAIRAVSTQRGRDPRDFVLVAFGGSGPLHAVELARAVGIERVVVPEHPGLFSAIGLLASPLEFSATRVLHRDLDAALMRPLAAALGQLRRDLERAAASAIADPADLAFEVAFECRYWGQSHDLTVTRALRPFAAADIASLREAFEDEHARAYGHRGAGERVVLVALRLTARRAPPPLATETVPAREGGPPEAALRDAYFGPEIGIRRTETIPRGTLGAAPRLGPLLIADYDSVIVVPPGCTARRLADGSIAIAIGAEAAP
jgi:N-methylhydantoinase A